MVAQQSVLGCRGRYTGGLRLAFPEVLPRGREVWGWRPCEDGGAGHDLVNEVLFLVLDRQGDYSASLGEPGVLRCAQCDIRIRFSVEELIEPVKPLPSRWARW